MPEKVKEIMVLGFQQHPCSSCTVKVFIMVAIAYKFPWLGEYCFDFQVKNKENKNVIRDQKSEAPILKMPFYSD